MPTTYARWAGYWPGASGPFAKPMNEIPKVVFSDSLAVRRLGPDDDRPRRPGHSRHAPQAGALRRIPARPRRVRFARSLVETGLIDEYRLVIHPVVLGAGERLFTAPLTIEPVSTTVFSRGAVAHVFTAHP